jgi:signal transduction histidine kinase/ActR/RegA family two-component response regulator
MSNLNTTTHGILDGAPVPTAEPSQDPLRRPCHSVWFLPDSPAAAQLDRLPKHFTRRCFSPRTLSLCQEEPGVLLVDLSDGPSAVAAIASAHDAGLPVVALVGDDAPHLAPGSTCYAYLSPSVSPLTLGTVLREACERTRVEMDARQMSKQLRDLHAIGIRLSAERDGDALLALILTKAREITRSDAGSLYVVEPQPGAGPHLRFKLAQNDTIPVALSEATLPISADSVAGYVARSGEVQRIDNAYALPPEAPCRMDPSFDVRTGYRTVTMLVVPLKTPAGTIIGVLELLNCKQVAGRPFASLEAIKYEVLPFPARYQELAASLASQAAVALENARLYQEIERSYHELARTQEELAQSQKIEAIGRLAGGVAHDFNNLLTIIMGRAVLGLTQVSGGHPAHQALESIKAAADRAAALTQQLLAFSRKHTIQPRVVDLNGVLVGLSPMLQRLVGEDVEFTIVQHESLWSVRADPGQLEQVIFNLTVNARDAMPHGGRLTLETSNILRGDPAVNLPTTGAGDAYVMLQVTDTGAGMDPKTRARIFEPFFTTKEVNKGTGLGLSTVHGIVSQHGGVVLVDSLVGQGTTFRILLPREEAAAESVGPAPAASTAPRGTETVLVVEDDGEVRKLVREVLMASGYAVLEAADPAVAKALCVTSTVPVSLLVTDVVMPGMNGPQLAESIQEVCPGLRVLYLSGYTADALGRHGVEGPGITLLSKPFPPEQLARSVREVLDSQPERP